MRGNPEFVYADHKRVVEEMLAAERPSNPGLEQVILRIGTILGESVDNQITALFDRQAPAGDPRIGQPVRLHLG